jgi:hypothetical protein
MRRPSSETLALIGRLPQPDLAGAATIGVIEAIGEQGEAAAIGHLTPFVAAVAAPASPFRRILQIVSSEARGQADMVLALAGAAATALARILWRLPVRRIPGLEELRDQGSPWGPLAAWYALSADGTPALGHLPDGRAALAIATFHHSGYVREAAVRALGARGESDGFALPFLVVRLNDWVAEVRTAARAMLEPHLEVAEADALWRVVPLLDWLRTLRRVDHGPFIERLEALLGRPEARPARLRALEAHDLGVRRSAARMVLSEEPLDAGLQARLLDDDDGVVRLLAAQQLARVSLPERAILARRVLADPLARVRRCALDLPGIAAEDPRLLTDALSDRQQALRRLAREKLAALQPAFDFAAHYRQLLATGPPARVLCGALLGLGECGEEVDVLLVERWLADGRVKVRAAALQAVAALDTDSVGPFVEALRDPSRRQSRLAARILAKRPRTGLQDLVLELASTDEASRHTRIHALDVVCAAISWSWLPRLLRLTASPNRELAALARERISGAPSLEPTVAEWDAVEAALAASALAPEERGALRRALSVWRPRRHLK